MKKIFFSGALSLASPLAIVACAASPTEAKIDLEAERKDLKTHLQQLNWKLKAGIDLSQIRADTIQNETDLKQIAELENTDEQKYLYEFRAINLVDEETISINYRVKLISAPNVVTQVFLSEITGFQSSNPILSELKNLARQATFSVTDKQRLASTVKANEINWDQQSQNPDIEATFSDLKAHDQSGALGFKMVLTKEQTRVQIVIEPKDAQAITGFQTIQIGALDAAASPNIILPEGAISYKGNLAIKPAPPPVIAHSEFKKMVDFMTWEEFVLEMLYQARFILWQQYSDNFSEIDYYTVVDEKHKKLTVEAVGIVKTAMTVDHYLQGIDNLNSGTSNDAIKTVTYQKGDVVKINFRSRWDENNPNAWRPLAPASAHLFSYATPPNKIPSTKQPVFLVGITRWYLNWTRNQETIYQENTLNFRNPIFVFWYARKPWKTYLDD